MATHKNDTGQDLSLVDGIALIGEKPVDLTGQERYDYFEDEAEGQLLSLRLERNKRLAETDWWANSDRTMTSEQTTYRQALRDITNTYSRYDTVVWPTKP